MDRIPWQDRVVIEPNLHHGEPCIRGTRIPISIILGSLADKMSLEEIIRAYPQLSVEDIRAALSYAADVMRTDVLTPLP